MRRLQLLFVLLSNVSCNYSFYTKNKGKPTQNVMLVRI